MNENIKLFGSSINRLIAGEDLSRATTVDLFTQVFSGQQPEMHQGALLSAITAKGPSPAEIAGAWEVIYNMDTTRVTPAVGQPLVDNCGTGMDSFKTFNISTGASIVAAAAGVCLARHGARAITSRCGTVDLCEALGVEVEGSPDQVRSSIETCGLGLFNGMSAAVHPQALFRILSQIGFGSILNIAASMANPANPTYGVRGVYAQEMIEPVILAMREIGFQKAMVFHGCCGSEAGGMDELSPVAESRVAELTASSEIRWFTLQPAEVDIRPAINLESIAAGHDPRQEALRLLRVLAHKEHEGLYETICLNTAPILYLSEAVASLKEGVQAARELIDSGRALEQLRNWVGAQNADPAAGSVHLEKLLAKV